MVDTPTPTSLPPVVEPATATLMAGPALRGRTTSGQLALLVLGAVAFIYFARPVILPVLLACIAAMVLKPVIRWLARLHIPPPLSAAIVLLSLVAILGFAFSRLSGPAMAWMNAAPENLSLLRQRINQELPCLSNLNQAAAAVTDMGATESELREEQRRAPTVELKDTRGTQSILDWTGTMLVGVGEIFVLVYLLLASGNLFRRKLVHVMPTWTQKKQVVEISREIESHISHYLLSVLLINISLGVVVSCGLYLMEVPDAAMWGTLVAALNFIPYFGPFVVFVLLAALGLLSFDGLWRGLLPAGWYLLVHLLEANLVTPIVLGRRFTLNPVAIFVSLIFWTWLWGVPGALLSAPILVSIKVVCDRIPKLAAVGDLLAN